MQSDYNCALSHVTQLYNIEPSQASKKSAQPCITAMCLNFILLLEIDNFVSALGYF